MEQINLDTKGKIKNWFYYHRWHIVIAVFLILCVVFVFFQARDREDYDTLIFYAGPCYFSEGASNNFEDAFKSIGKDYNGDGKKAYQLVAITILSENQLAQAQVDANEDFDILYRGDYKQNLSDFHDQIATGEGVLCLIDESFYCEVRSQDRLVKLSDIFDSSPVGALDDGYGIRLCDSLFGKYFECFQSMPKTTILCLKKKPLTMKDEDYQAGKELFLAVASFSYEKKETQ